MLINGKKIDDVKIATMRECFERNHQRVGGQKRGYLTFDELLDRVSLDCISLSKIAVEHGVTRQAMHQAYHAYFRPLLPGRKTGLQRKKICTIKRKAIRSQDFSDSDLLRFIAREAERFGCTVKRIQSTKEYATRLVQPILYLWQLSVRNRSCIVHHIGFAKSFAKRARRKYGQILITREVPCDFRIVVTSFPERPRRIFIIPSKLISVGVVYYLPEVKAGVVYKNTHLAIDWWHYENAWHLITSYPSSMAS